MKSHFKLLAALFIVIGVLLVLMSIHFGQAASPALASGATSTSAIGQSKLTMAASLWTLVQTIGVSLIGFSLFGILVDTESWREYFSSRLRDIMVNQDYLEGLEPEKLRDLQNNAWRALYKNPNIGQQGTFLSFCGDTLHRFIDDPYREDVIVEILVKPHDDLTLEVIDRVTFVCKSAGGKIQPNVRFYSDPGEFLLLKSLRIEVRHPSFGLKLLADCEDLTQGDPDKFDKECSLTEFAGLDGLTVTTESNYLMSFGSFQTWSMAHPTRNFDLVLRFPTDLQLQLRSFVLRPELLQKSFGEGYGRIRYPSWMVPESGVAWQLHRPAVKPETAPTVATAT